MLTRATPGTPASILIKQVGDGEGCNREGETERGYWGGGGGQWEGRDGEGGNREGRRGGGDREGEMGRGAMGGGDGMGATGREGKEGE